MSQTPERRLEEVNGKKYFVSVAGGYATWVCVKCGATGTTNHGFGDDPEKDAADQVDQHFCKVESK